MKFFFKRKIFKSGNSLAVLLPKEIYNIFMEGYGKKEVKVTLEDNKIIIERITD